MQEAMPLEFPGQGSKLSRGTDASTGIDGTKPLAAYRRLLAMLYHIRNVRHESGPGYESSSGRAAASTVVQKTERELRALEKVCLLVSPA